jgi:hypothetical protein
MHARLFSIRGHHAKKSRTKKSRTPLVTLNNQLAQISWLPANDEVAEAAARRELMAAQYVARS